MAPATRNIAIPTVPPIPIEIPPSTRPTAQDHNTTMSVRFGPQRSTSEPQKKLAATATTVNPSNTRFATFGVMPIAWTVTTLMTTMTVFTASE